MIRRSFGIEQVVFTEHQVPRFDGGATGWACLLQLGPQCVVDALTAEHMSAVQLSHNRLTPEQIDANGTHGLVVDHGSIEQFRVGAGRKRVHLQQFHRRMQSVGWAVACGHFVTAVL